MTPQTLVRKIEALEEEITDLKQPKSILGKIFVDDVLIQRAEQAIFDFDIRKFVTKKDLALWKKKR